MEQTEQPRKLLILVQFLVPFPVPKMEQLIVNFGTVNFFVQRGLTGS